jgi:para-nitrobenzyl esterase
MQVVKTDKGYVSGTVIGEAGKEVAIFRGIPFATPPVGNLRWQPPQPRTPWKGIRECTHFSPMSPQESVPALGLTLPMSEDCLYLNVLTPAKKNSEKLPVMVWLHTGGYTLCTGNDTILNHYRLPQHGVVLVTVNHRLGPLGMLAHPLLSKESSQGISGNYQFLDIIESLKWVKNNVAAFGGDPDNVTIFGESGGGAKVSVMMASPLAKGLFHSAICQSGIAAANYPGQPLADCENYGKTLFEKLGISTLEEARRVPWNKIVEASVEMEPPIRRSGQALPVWDASIDGRVLPLKPMDAFSSGVFNPVPLITCLMLGELNGHPPTYVYPALVPATIRMLEAANKKGVNGFACIFDQVPAVWRQEGCISIHSIAQPYIFGDWDNTTGFWKMLFTLSAHASGAKTANPGLDATDKNISEAMMSLWTQFAKKGKPAVKGLIDWPAYETAGDRYLYVNQGLEIKSGYSRVAQELK